MNIFYNYMYEIVYTSCIKLLISIINFKTIEQIGCHTIWVWAKVFDLFVLNLIWT